MDLRAEMEATTGAQRAGRRRSSARRGTVRAQRAAPRRHVFGLAHDLVDRQGGGGQGGGRRGGQGGGEGGVGEEGDGGGGGGGAGGGGGWRRRWRWRRWCRWRDLLELRLPHHRAEDELVVRVLRLALVEHREPPRLHEGLRAVGRAEEEHPRVQVGAQPPPHAWRRSRAEPPASWARAEEEAGSGGPGRASKRLRRRSGVSRSALGPWSHRAGRRGAVVKEGRRHFHQPLHVHRCVGVGVHHVAGPLAVRRRNKNVRGGA